MTLDEALDEFDARPCRETAEALLKEAETYNADEMIGDDEFREIAARCRPYLPAN